MIPILYAPNANTFITNGLGPLSDCVSAVVHEQRNGVFELEIHMPTGGLHFSEIGLGSLIKAKPSPTRTDQLFTVYSIEKTLDGMMAAIYCEHVSYRMSLIPVLPFTATSASEALQSLRSHALENCPFTFWTDVLRDGTYKQTVPSSMKSRLQGEQGSILQVYQGEYEFNNYQVSLWLNRGVDRGVVIEYGKNIKTLQQDSSIQNVVTGILPYWTGMVGETETTVMLPEYILYSSHASDFPSARTICVDMSQDFDEQPTTAQLRAAGNKYITDNNIGVPDIGFDVDFALLAQSLDYKDIGLAERVELCDIVTVRFAEFGIDAQAKVVEEWFDVLRERYDKVRIGNQRFTLSHTIAQQSQEIVASEARQTSWFQQALDQATALINGDLTGASMITQTDSAGNPVGLIFMDTNNPATAVNCIRINSNGIGFSNQGPQGPYSSTWDITNTLNMANINVINLIVDHLRSLNASQEYKLEADNSTLWLASKWQNIWHNAVSLANAGELRPHGQDIDPTLTLSSYGFDEDGEHISGFNYAQQTKLTPYQLTIGELYDGTYDDYSRLKVSNAEFYRLLKLGGLNNQPVQVSLFDENDNSYHTHYCKFVEARGNNGTTIWALGSQDSTTEENSGGNSLESGIISRGDSGTFSVKGYQAIVIMIHFISSNTHESFVIPRSRWQVQSTWYVGTDSLTCAIITTSFSSSTGNLTVTLGSSSGNCQIINISGLR